MLATYHAAEKPYRVEPSPEAKRLLDDFFNAVVDRRTGELADVGQFASRRQKGGEFYTPSCIVRLLTEVIEPYHGRIVETLRLANVRHAKCRMNLTKPRCALGKRWPCASTSGGMFFSSARFVAEHKRQLAAGQSAGNRPKDYSGEPTRELSIHGVEKTDETGRLCRLNLAVHGLEGDIRHGGQVNSYYDDPHKATGQFDFVLANPPFNANAVDKEAEGLLDELRKRDR